MHRSQFSTPQSAKFPQIEQLMFELRGWMFELNRVTVFPVLVLEIKNMAEIPATKDMASPNLEGKTSIYSLPKVAGFKVCTESFMGFVISIEHIHTW